MNNLIWLGVGVVVALVIALIFEDSRDWIMDILAYIFSFEWLGDLWEFITGMFEDLGEFSVGGLIFAVLVVGFIYGFRNQMLIPFLNHMGRVEYLFWGGATYLSGAIFGYLIGKKLFED